MVQQTIVWNPMDQLLVALSSIHCDGLLMMIIMVYIICCTLRGVRYLGIRVAWIRLFHLVPHKSNVQGILFTATIIMLTTIVSIVSMMYIAPRYMLYGGLTYIDTVSGVVTPCSLSMVNTSASDESCKLSQLAIVLQSTWSYMVMYYKLCQRYIDYY